MANQFIMGAALNDSTLGHHQNLIRIENSAEPVGNHKNSMIPLKALDCLLHKQLSLRIQCTSCLVEDQYIWISQNGSC